MKNLSVKKLALAGMFCALCVVGSVFSFPMFGSKCAPVQHMVNVLCAVLLGPWWGVGVAFVASLLRNLLGLGSLMAFPGSMFGALLCGLAYHKTKNLIATVVGEVFGTSILGGLCAWPVAIFLMGKSAADIAFYAYIVPFLISTAVGAVIAGAVVFSLQRSGALRSMQNSLSWAEVPGMLKTAFENLRSRNPLIHNITNYVTVNDCANMVLACGASPIMADDAAEVEEITAICGGLNINIGTLNSRTVTSMLLAGKKANQLGHPVVLDPVGAGASRLRTDTAFRLLREVQFTVIRGNISEIKTLASGAGTTKGVDADVADKVTEENLDSAVAFAKAFAARTGAVVAITGAIDIVADAQKAYCIRNGNAMMSSITGTGCQLSALTAAFVTANPGHPLEAAAAAVCAMGLAGEVAHQRLTPQDGNATYRNYIIDAIYNMTPEQLEKGANYEMR